MRKALLIIFGVLGALILLALVVVAMQPTDYVVTRSATIPAPPAVVFEHINDLHKWEAWSPWAKKDPSAKNTFDGAESGEGAKFSWAGNDEIGEGTLSIVESRPHQFIKMLLEFRKPFEDKCDTTFAFKPVDDGKATEVTWSMAGRNNFMAKAMCMFMDMDAMVGGDFEQGLANIAEVVKQDSTKNQPTGDTANE